MGIVKGVEPITTPPLEYRQGWNHASAGALPTMCPYAGIKQHYWLNGLSAYWSSPHYCQALRRYNQYLERPITLAELDDMDIQSDTDGWSLGILKYEDGSVLIMTPTMIHIENKHGEPIASRERIEVEALKEAWDKMTAV